MSNPQPPDERREPWNSEAQWQQLQERIAASVRGRNSGQGLEIDPGRPRTWRVYAGVAAAAAACVIVALTLASRAPVLLEPLQWAQFSTAAGAHDSLRLADGTLVTVGPSTTVRYAMTASRREIELRGLASFDVTHNAARTFRVRAGNAVALDVGTRFVVRHYELDSGVTVFVSSGTVTLSDSAHAHSLTLTAGNTGRVERNGATAMESNADSTRNEAWLRGQLLFRNTTLADAASQIGNWFGIAVRVPDATLANRRVTAVYTQPTLNGVLDALAATLGVSYTRHDSVVTLQPGGRHE